jgi:hypothetical protein
MKWAPVGAVSSIGLNWDTFDATHRFDPYLAWQDLTGFLGKAIQATALPLILELKQPLKNEAELKQLNAMGIAVTPHYIKFTYPNREAPRYVTALCTDLDRLDNFAREVALGNSPVLRYEISSGFRNPDALILEMGSQQWETQKLPTLGSDIVGFIDYGCAFAHRSFRAEDKSGQPGDSRVAWLWNQQNEGQSTPPGGRAALHWRPNVRFACGQVANGQDLNEFSKQYRNGSGLDEWACYRDAGYEPIRRHATHGTHIMDVATGFPNPTLARSAHGGSTSERHKSRIIFVQLPRFVAGTQVSGLLRAQVLDAAHYIAGHRAGKKKAVINLSYGSNCGPHDGSSILERALDELIAGHKSAIGEQNLHIVVPSGNALDRSVHAQLHLRTGQADTMLWDIAPNDPSDSFLELWVPYPQTTASPAPATIRVRVTPPGGAPSPWVSPGASRRLMADGQTLALVIGAAIPCQSETGAMLLLAVGPTEPGPSRPASPYGEWHIEVENVSRGSLLVNAWCERDDPVFGNEAGPRQAQFGSHVERTGTLNSIAHGRETIVVGGYETHDSAATVTDGPIASMSGTGPGRDAPGRERHPPAGGIAKPGPEVLTPCELGLDTPGIAAAAVLSDDQVSLSGTSVAAAFYTRLLIENKFVRPVPRVPDKLNAKPLPGRDPHPDDGEGVVRLP